MQLAFTVYIGDNYGKVWARIFTTLTKAIVELKKKIEKWKAESVNFFTNVPQCIPHQNKRFIIEINLNRKGRRPRRPEKASLASL